MYMKATALKDDQCVQVSSVGSYISETVDNFVFFKEYPDLVDSNTGDDTGAFFSFLPAPWPLFPPLCFGEPLDFLGDSLMFDCSGNS